MYEALYVFAHTHRQLLVLSGSTSLTVMFTTFALSTGPPDAMPLMGRIPSYEGAYINAGHNCW